jgi:hypothetical protein
MDAKAYARELNHDYERLHTEKEDAFWTAYMGLAEDADEARADLDRKEIELQRWLQDPDRLRETRERLETASDEETRTILRGWVRTLLAHGIESEEGRTLAAEIVEQEGRLARARGTMELGYRDASGELVEKSSVELSLMLVSEREEALRRAAWEGLRSIEGRVLEHGFLDIVRQRNRLGRMQGGEDYYDWKVKAAEGLRKREIFDLLDELEEKTRDAAARFLDELRAEHGEAAVTPWNARYLSSGDLTAEQDPYFPLEHSLARWGRSFAALGIDYNGAELVLDLLDRKGKHENGFMHGPVPAWREEGVYRPARVQFTANAIPGVVGSGKRGTATLFHEGGHAAHFANIDMPAPCFAQEFAPTSVAFAEVQSMFLDNLLDDADWQARYARTAAGEPMPIELIEKGVATNQRSLALGLRMMLAVCYCERALYEIPEAELTPERALEAVRAEERRLLGLDASPRPALSIPHLISGEASAYYHGYVLAQIAVDQTREFFAERDGHLVDNPRIGPDLREHYWRPGNSVRFLDFIERLTGRSLSADAIARRVNRTVDEALVEAREAVAKIEDIPEHADPADLGARIRIVHGHERIADTAEGGFHAADREFERWIENRVDLRD